MAHPVDVNGLSPAELAKAVGAMRYDCVADFLTELSEELDRQALGDRAAGRIRLSNMLAALALDMHTSAEVMSEIFIFCRPFMKDELGET